MKPSDLNLPAKFTEFRTQQIEAIDHAIECFSDGYRHCPEGLPVGIGKSLVAMGLARSLDVRTVILTGTRGLQDQYGSDFGSCGLVDVRGKSNYTCPHFGHRISCHLGALEGCPMIEGNGCSYEFHRDEARRAPTVITNYSYWFHVNERQPALGDVQLLILDECHQAFHELARYLQVEVRESWLRRVGLEAPDNTIITWATFALTNVRRVSNLAKQAAKQLRDSPSPRAHQLYYELSSLEHSFGDMMTMAPEYWVLDSTKVGTQYGRIWTFDCIWPAGHAVKLFQAAPRVLLMSGTLRPSGLKLLGIGEGDYEFREWPRVFPARNTPVYMVPTAFVRRGMDDDEKDLCVERIDEIIDTRLDRKGLIHTVNYDWQQYIHAHSRHRGIMDYNSNQDTESLSATKVFERFKQAAAPRILISPSFSTGWDFPGRDCEYIIIAKVPFPSKGSPVVEARNKYWPNYSHTMAYQDLVQSAYRGTRFHDDRCEVFIIDNCFWGLRKRVPYAAPDWFKVIDRITVPPPGPRAPEVE